MIKCYKRWRPAIWTIFIALIFIILIFLAPNIYGAKYLEENPRTDDRIERADLMNDQKMMGKVYRDHLNALFSKWDSILENDRKELVSALKNISTSMAVWVGLIAAICTILPIVLGINASINFKYDLAHMEKIMNEKTRDIIKLQEHKMEETEKQFKTKVDKLEKKLGSNTEALQKSKISQVLSDLSVHMRVISELQDFESKDKGTLSKPELYVQVMDNVIAELTKTNKKIESTEIDDKDNNTHIGITLMLCMLKRLLASVECTFTDYNLITLQLLRSNIDNYVTNLIDNNTEITNAKAIETAIGFVRKTRELFCSFDTNKNTSDKS